VIRRHLLGLLALPLAAACVSTTENRELATIEIVPGVTTKEDVVRQLGAPRGIRRQGEDLVLSFSYGEENGTGYGLGTYAIAIAVGSTHTGVDTIEVVVGPDRLVRSFRLAQVPRENPKWPSDG
jgi:hypothetical protein